MEHIHIQIEHRFADMIHFTVEINEQPAAEMKMTDAAWTNFHDALVEDRAGTPTMVTLGNHAVVENGGGI